jgi:hypothetical protein
MNGSCVKKKYNEWNLNIFSFFTGTIYKNSNRLNNLQFDICWLENFILIKDGFDQTCFGMER